MSVTEWTREPHGLLARMRKGAAAVERGGKTAWLFPKRQTHGCQRAQKLPSRVDACEDGNPRFIQTLVHLAPRVARQGWGVTANGDGGSLYSDRAAWELDSRSDCTRVCI